MTEFDFEELDKAVNSLMKDTPGSNTENSAPATPVVSQPASDQSTAPVADADTAATPSTPTASGSLAVKRRGRFMDVVHPSSDMRTSTPTPVNRQGNTIVAPNSAETVPTTPEVSVDEPKTPEDSPAVQLPDVEIESTAPVTGGGSDVEPSASTQEISSAPSPVPVTPPDFTEPTKDVAAPEAAKIEWPDPIDMMAKSEQENISLEDSAAEDDKTSEVPEPNSTDAATDSKAQDEKPVEEKPMSSPFLPDAKVEKRPLGGTPSEDLLTETDIPGAEEKPETVMPEEFNEDIVKAEAAPTTAAPVVAEVKDEKSETDKNPVAINQQYTEKPSSGTQTNTPIYDTENYHNAVAHPAKKKSGWAWVFWVIILLILGAAGGAAYFYFTTQ